MAPHWTDGPHGSIAPATLARVNGTAVTRADSRKLLTQLRAGEHVELQIDFTAFQQVAGESNRNFLRFKKGILRSLAKSFVNVPVLLDHNQENVEARAGTVTASQAVPIEGGVEFQMTASITNPTAVEAVLLGNLDRFSIGWNPGTLDTVLCSIENRPVFTVCSHFPGDLAVDDDGNELGRAEFIFTQAEGVEVSGVNVPAVAGTGIDEIRAALSAVTPGLGFRTKTPAGDPPQATEVKRMDKLALALGLPADADQATIAKAITANKVALAAHETAAGAQQSQITALTAQVAVIEAREVQGRVDKLFADNADRMPPARDAAGNVVVSECETRLRAFAASDFTAASALVASMPKQTPAAVAPVALALPSQPAAPAGNEILAKQLRQLRISDADFAKFNPINGTELDSSDHPVSFNPRHWDA